MMNMQTILWVYKMSFSIIADSHSILTEAVDWGVQKNIGCEKFQKTQTKRSVIESNFSKTASTPL